MIGLLVDCEKYICDPSSLWIVLVTTFVHSCLDFREFPGEVAFGSRSTVIQLTAGSFFLIVIVPEIHVCVLGTKSAEDKLLPDRVTAGT